MRHDALAGSRRYALAINDNDEMWVRNVRLCEEGIFVDGLDNCRGDSQVLLVLLPRIVDIFLTAPQPLGMELGNRELAIGKQSQSRKHSMVGYESAIPNDIRDRIWAAASAT